VASSVRDTWRGDEVASRLITTSRSARRNAADQLLQKTLPRVPIATGRLRSSGRVVDISTDSSVVSFDADYAYWVHEMLTNRHAVGEAKFLEQTLEDNRGALMRALAMDVGGAFR
jgi:hypothetical protein